LTVNCQSASACCTAICDQMYESSVRGEAPCIKPVASSERCLRTLIS